MVDVNSIAVQQADNNNQQLLDTYGQHVAAAAVDSTAASASAVSRSPAADAQARAINPPVMAADDNSSSSDGAHLFGLKSDVAEMAHKAADGITDLKNSIADKFHSSKSPPIGSGTAAVAGHSQLFSAGAQPAAVTSTDATGGTSLSLLSPFSLLFVFLIVTPTSTSLASLWPHALCLPIRSRQPTTDQHKQHCRSQDLHWWFNLTIASSHIATSAQSTQHCLCSLSMHATL